MEQLFLTNFEIVWDFFRIKEKRVLHQVKNVLRYKKWNIFWIQDINNSSQCFVRYKVVFENVWKDFLDVSVVDIQKETVPKLNNWISVACLNKYAKMEFVVQKLSEIGIENIVFRISDRSVLKNFSENKMQRLEKIKIEAVEQSKSKIIPNIKVFENLSDFFAFENFFLFEVQGQNISDFENKKSFWNWSCGVIWPEGWFSQKEMEYFEKLNLFKLKLSENILRSETAAILGWWFVQSIG